MFQCAREILLYLRSLFSGDFITVRFSMDALINKLILMTAQNTEIFDIFRS